MPKFPCTSCSTVLDSEAIPVGAANCPSCGKAVRVPRFPGVPPRTPQPRASAAAQKLPKANLISVSPLRDVALRWAIVPSIIAYILVYGAGRDSIPASIGTFLGASIVSGLVGAGIATVLIYWTKAFWPAFIRIYGIVIIPSALVFAGMSMVLKTTVPRTPVGMSEKQVNSFSELELSGLRVLAPRGAKRSWKPAADGESHLLVGGGIDVIYGRISGCEVVVTHAEQTQGPVDLMDAYSRGVREYQNLSAVSDLRSSFGEMQVSGQSAIWSEIACKMGGKAHLSKAIDVSDGMHHWGVVVLGDPSAVERIWGRVKNSVRLIR